MRRIALALAAVGMIAATLMAGAPAQAHELWSGGRHWQQHARQHEMRAHHDWRFGRHMPHVTIFRG